jgi:hypothetical protein
MNIRACELKTHLYAIAPHHCSQQMDEPGFLSLSQARQLHLHPHPRLEYSRECAYDEPLTDLISNRTIECDPLSRCPMNSYCNTPTHRCCVKGNDFRTKKDLDLFNRTDCCPVITAILPYRMCLSHEQCGLNMMCLGGLCECARQDYVPARQRRECSKMRVRLNAVRSVLRASSCCASSPQWIELPRITVWMLWG